MARPFQSKHSELKEAGKAFEDWVRFNTSRRSAFGDMIHTWVIALRNQYEPRDEEWTAREAEYEAIRAKVGADGMDIFAQCLAAIAVISQREAGDHLGEFYQELAANWKEAGQFFTPYSLSTLTAGITFTKEVIDQAIAEKGYFSVYEPTCGSGGMIIASADAVRALGFDPVECMRVYASDIDRICVDMTYIQTMLQGVPCWVQQANALDPHSGDRYGYRLATPSFVASLGREIIANQVAEPLKSVA